MHPWGWVGTKPLLTDWEEGVGGGGGGGGSRPWLCYSCKWVSLHVCASRHNMHMELESELESESDVDQSLSIVMVTGKRFRPKDVHKALADLWPGLGCGSQ